MTGSASADQPGEKPDEHLKPHQLALDNGSHSNATHQARPKTGATQERRPEAVRCQALFDVVGKDTID
jgi:hypothetical protein